MPPRRIHNKEAKKYGIDVAVADDVNRRKDVQATKRPGVIHRGYNHGVGTNIKYDRKHGLQGVAAGFIHDSLDRVDGYKKRGLKGSIFLKERVKTWTFGKGIKNMLDPDYDEI